MTRTSKIFATAMLFAITLTALPRHAWADTSATTTASADGKKGESTDGEHKDWIEIVTAIVTATTEVAL